jgi:hypothetical protein
MDSVMCTKLRLNKNVFFTCDILDAAATRRGQGSACKQVKTYNYSKPLRTADANPK